ncbi:MAG: hypothetical protein UZ13_00059 [Chloroflexi bacterium OLB13]|nr:MAG: hypothetical protein UZ13_00059 [Chloroflexi bacterium OLB13]
MSAVKTRSFTIRLTPEDQAALAELCALYGLDRPASVRRAVRQVLAWKKRLGKSGYFVPAGESQPTEFPIRLNRKDAHE